MKIQQSELQETVIAKVIYKSESKYLYILNLMNEGYTRRYPLL